MGHTRIRHHPDGLLATGASVEVRESLRRGVLRANGVQSPTTRGVQIVGVQPAVLAAVEFRGVKKCAAPRERHQMCGRVERSEQSSGL